MTDDLLLSGCGFRRLNPNIWLFFRGRRHGRKGKRNAAAEAELPGAGGAGEQQPPRRDTSAVRVDLLTKFSNFRKFFCLAQGGYAAGRGCG